MTSAFSPGRLTTWSILTEHELITTTMMVTFNKRSVFTAECRFKISHYSSLLGKKKNPLKSFAFIWIMTYIDSYAIIVNCICSLANSVRSDHSRDIQAHNALSVIAFRVSNRNIPWLEALTVDRWLQEMNGQKLLSNFCKAKAKIRW